MLNYPSTKGPDSYNIYVNRVNINLSLWQNSAPDLGSVHIVIEL